jgi:hypothetical protein
MPLFDVNATTDFAVVVVVVAPAIVPDATYDADVGVASPADIAGATATIVGTVDAVVVLGFVAAIVVAPSVVVVFAARAV